MGSRRILPLKQQTTADLFIQILFYSGFVSFWAASAGQFLLDVLVDIFRKPEQLLESWNWLMTLAALTAGVVFILLPTIITLTMLKELTRRAWNKLWNKNQHHDNSA